MGPAAWRPRRYIGKPSDHPSHTHTTAPASDGGAPRGSPGPRGWKPAPLSWPCAPGRSPYSPSRPLRARSAQLGAQAPPATAPSTRNTLTQRKPTKTFSTALTPDGAPRKLALPKKHSTGARAQTAVQVRGVQESRAAFSAPALPKCKAGNSLRRGPVCAMNDAEEHPDFFLLHAMSIAKVGGCKVAP